MYLIDTNIILELLLDQDHADSVAQFFNRVPPENLFISEFSFYSLGVILLRLKRYETFIHAIGDLLLSGFLSILRLEVQDITRVADVAKNFDLDFDDAYQYVTAEKYNLGLLSFDRDFDRTPRGRKTLKEIMEGE